MGVFCEAFTRSLGITHNESIFNRKNRRQVVSLLELYNYVLKKMHFYWDENSSSVHHFPNIGCLSDSRFIGVPMFSSSLDNYRVQFQRLEVEDD